MRTRSLHILLTLAALTCASCQSTDHETLAARDWDSGIIGEAGGKDAAKDASEEADGFALDAEQADGDDASDAPWAEEAGSGDGPSRLTFVHGLADATAVRLCFHARSGNAFVPMAGDPIPPQSEGLAFARSLVLETLPEGLDPATQDLRVVVYAGDLAAASGKSCADLASPPAGLRALPMPVFPAGTLSSGRSWLAVLSGCMGGAGHQATAQEYACGTGYTPDNPNAMLMMAKMTRAPVAGSIGVQVFGGSLASQSILVRFLTVEQGTTDLATSVGQGELEPKAPDTQLAVQSLGSSPGAATIDAYEQYQSTPVSTPLAEALQRGGLSVEDFADGRNYTFVFVGAKAGTGAGVWWQPFTMLAVRSDP